MASAIEPLVRLVGLSRHYKMGSHSVPAVTEVNLVIYAGEAVALLGPSGSGKSTLLNLIGGLDRPTTGDVWVDGANLARASQKQLVEHRKRRVGFIFQGFNLLPHRSALENVEVPMIIAGLPASLRRARARDLLDRVGLSKREDHSPSQLSGGEQQRVAIARSLAMEPKVLLADEPTGNLDSATGEGVMDLLSDLNEAGLTIILVTHDMSVASYADRYVQMKDGRVTSDENSSGRVTAASGSSQQ